MIIVIILLIGMAGDILLDDGGLNLQSGKIYISIITVILLILNSTRMAINRINLRCNFCIAL